ncbi:MAG: ParB/RepB/Spo0J family partition protein [Lactimicrobium massiliense]|nr:ParB/RepB/Spo0J family partition protein [Lactimicrobium massiliense]MDD6561173.1 ParB/RepB/Spo0J family partition protein [Lactimicrobium massiliense]MDD6675120.1 ParB/RepB/Spo0J family partition protein [Lactimicrobium massiliense]MDD6727188.1 ParB/RepB/Spo0J family partition protein [Lactimicrobium massiliense]MDY3931177.1 ParB/RepB/Spo0J family partition protein [Erysipelotrichaceae bacterium]
MRNKGANISLKSYDEIFSTEETRQDTGEHVIMVKLDKIHPFKNHPFKVVDDEDMRKTADSIREYGVLVPAIVRPLGNGEYEMISGHRRRYASKLAGKDEMPVIVREMDDDTATILMVDSNLQREHILPSERAKAYQMKMEAMKHQGERTDLTSRQVGTKLRADEQVAKDTGESARTVQRFVRLNHLIPELLEMVDEKKIAFNPAVELSYLKPQEQKEFYEAMDIMQTPPSLSQAQRLKKSSQEGRCTPELIESIMDEDKKSPLNRVVFDFEDLRKYFPKNYTSKQMQTAILLMLDQWSRTKAKPQEK